MPKRLKQIAVVSAVFILVAGGLALIAGFIHKPSENLSLATTSNTGVKSRKVETSNPTDAIAPKGEPISKIGIITCLTPKDNSGAQAASCALGLYSNDGNYYGLNSEDSILVGNLPSGQRVQVTGLLQKPNTPFNISGVIYVSKLRKL